MAAQNTDRLAIERAGVLYSVTAAEIAALGLGTASVAFARIRRSTNQSIAAGSVYLDLVWEVAATQIGGTFWTTGATVTIPETGVYQVDFEGTVEGAAVAVTCNVQMIVNGVTVIGEDERMSAAGATSGLEVNATRQFTAGDTVKVQLKHNNATALNLLTQGDHSPDIRLLKAGGVSGVADSRETQLLTDFAETVAKQNDFTMVIIGTGSNFTTASVAGAMGPNHPGVAQWRSGTTANSGCYCATNSATFRLGGGEQWDVNFYTAPVLTTVLFRTGALDSITSTAPLDGMYFEMSTSGAIVGKTMNNSVGSTTATIATLAASTYYHGRITLNAAANLATFTVFSDVGVQLGQATLATNIPSAAGRELGWLSLATSSGTVAIELCHMDRQKLSNPGRIVQRGAL